MTIDEIISVLQEAKRGAPIQCRPKTRAVEWYDMTWEIGDEWQFGENEYRVKPEPREWWANIYGSENPTGYLHKTKEKADHADCCQSFAGTRTECIKVREILE